MLTVTRVLAFKVSVLAMVDGKANIAILEKKS